MKATGEGKRFILAACLIGLAALNTGNNLIYLILSLMLAFIVISLALLRLNLAGLALRLSVPHPVFAGEASLVSLSVINSRERLPAYSLRLAPGDAAFSAEPAYCGVIEPLSVSEVHPRVVFQRRGYFRETAFVIDSGFPFLLFRRKITAAAPSGILVYPALLEDIERLPEGSAAGDGRDFRFMGRGDELHSLREYRYGDDLRRIHWKASAKTRNLMVREYAEHQSARVSVVLDNRTDAYGVDGGGDGSPIIQDETFEKAVSLAGSVARHFLDAGFPVRLLSCRKTVPFGSGAEHLFTILDVLAVVRKEDAWEGPEPSGRDGISILVTGSRRNALSLPAGQGDTVLYAADI